MTILNALMVLLMTTSCSLAAAEGWVESGPNSAPPTPALRAFGSVTTTSTTLRGPAGEAWVTTFRCQDAAHAQTLAGKYLADLELSPATVKTLVAGHPVRVMPGAAVLTAVSGADVRVVISVSGEALATLLAARPELGTGAIDAAPYPTYLDRFDRFGWGFYGLGGFNNAFDWQHWPQSAGKPATPLDDFAFIKEQGLRFEPWLDPTSYDDSDGIVKNTEAEWMVSKAREADLNVSFRLYGAAGGAAWPARRFPDLLEQPFPFLMNGWMGRSQLFWKTQPHLSWSSVDAQKYMAATTMAMMKPFVGEPHVLGWMHPQGELLHHEWYDMHADDSPLARSDWRAWLGQHATLAEVSALYDRSRQPFAAWDDVPVPEFATFAGLNGSVADLGGTWSAKRETADGAGIARQWFAGATDATWRTLRVPGGDALFEVLNDRSGTDATWFRRTFELSAEQLARISAAKQVFLYWFPMSSNGIHVGADPHFNQVWINEVNVGGIGSWGALDVTAALKPGTNRIAVRLLGNTWDGRMFLSTEKPSIYPYLPGGKNRLWLMWNRWRKDAKHRGWDVILDGMRQIDPDRPIKLMSPQGFGGDRWLDLARRWGAFPHFTGEGIWFYPWYKRGAFLSGLPASSETAGPADNLADQFDSFRRTFLAGLNGHDAVFIAQTYTRNPELKDFWVRHAPVLRQMGKYDLAGPQVLIHRSSIATTGLVQSAPYPTLGEQSREIQSPWNWDLGRGTLQTLGHSGIYIDDGEVLAGKMAGYQVMIDCGNEILDPKVMASIAAWVKTGGTYISFPCTGRVALERPDAWLVQEMAGCGVAGLRTPGKGTVTVAAGSTLLPGLAGKSFPDQGHCLDWQNDNHVRWDVVLTPGPGADVVATYEDGGAAIVRAPLGTGQVILLGSGFWRQAADHRGLWWPEQLETDVIGALLTGAGQGPAPVTSSDRLVWAQPYRSNNGLDAVACVVSWQDAKEVETTVRMRLPRRPSAIRSYGVDGEQDLPFTWEAGEATVQLTMPAKEVKVLRALGVYGADEALAYWWSYQQRMWHALAKPTIDFSAYHSGRWADPTIDLRTAARWTATAPAGDAWRRPGYDDSAWKQTTLGVLTVADGAPRSVPLWVRCQVEVPADWRTDGSVVRLVSGSWELGGVHYLGGVRLAINGTVLHESPGAGYQDYAVTKLLQPGANTVTLEFLGDRPDTGLVGNLWLYHRAPSQAQIDLAGPWTGGGPGGVATTVTLPGQVVVNRPMVHVTVPAAWAGKRVRLVMEGEPWSLLGAWVNDRLIRRHHHHLSSHLDIDITDQIRFGADNELILAHGGEHEAELPDAAQPARWNITALHLELFDQP